MSAVSTSRLIDVDASHESMHEAARALLSKGNGLQQQGADGTLEVRAGKKPALSFTDQRLVLERPDCSISLLLQNEQGDSPLGDLRWQDYEGEARLLAWSLAHEDLVTALSQLFGGGLLPIAFRSNLPSELLWLELDWRDAAGHHSQGWLGLARTAIRALAEAPDWKRDPRRISTIGDVDAVSLNLIVPGRALDSAAIGALAPGDVLLVGMQADCEGRLQPDRDKARDVFGLPDGWTLRWHEGQWIVAAKPALASAAEPSRPQFLITSLALSLERIDALQPGSVAVGAAALIGSTVGILLHGSRFGEGVLVSMGAWLGVRLTNKEDHHGEGQHGLR